MEFFAARLTDSLGFYLNDDRKDHQLKPNDMFEVAAELQNISDEIVVQREMVSNVNFEIFEKLCFTHIAKVVLFWANLCLS